MDFELNLFAEEIRTIRKNLKLSQNDVFELIGVNTETLRRIENAKVIPKFETLDLLSSIYKVDVCEIFLRYRIKDYKNYINLKNDIYSKINLWKVHDLESNINELNELISCTGNSLYRNLMKQLKLMCLGIVVGFGNNKYKESLEYFNKAIKITTPDFDIKNLYDYTYSETEIRLITYMTLYYFEIDDYETTTRLLEFCLLNCSDNNLLKEKVATNLATSYIRSRKYREALELCDKSIEEAKKNTMYTNLATLYFNKATAEISLDIENYKNSFKKAIFLADCFEQTSTKNSMIKICKNKYKLDINPFI